MEYYFTYFIVFKSNENGFSGPIVLFRNLESVKKNTNGTMHLLDDDLNGTLGAIEYIMHLVLCQDLVQVKIRNFSLF